MIKKLKILNLFIGFVIIMTGCSQALSLIGGGGGYGPRYPNLFDIAYGNGAFIAIDNTNSKAVAIDANSGNVTVVGEIGCSNIEHIEYLNGNFVASYAGCEGYLYRSTDGSNWEEVSISLNPPPEFPNINITPVAYWAGYYFGWPGWWPAAPAISTDLENWQELEDLSEERYFCGATTTKDELLVNGFDRVAVNTDPVDPEDREFKTVSYIFSSRDGKSYTSSQLPDGMIICGEMAYGDGVLIVSNGLIDDWYYKEYSINTNYGLFSLSDGGDWEQTYANNEEKILDVAYGNGTFVAVGEKGLVVTSTDGLTWSEEHLGNGYNFNAVVYGNGSFVAVGDHGFVAVSADGSNWLVREVTVPW